MDIRSELVELSDDWYVAYLTMTPRQDAVYQISVDIDEGYLVDAEKQPMPQTFRSVENAQWVTGGCAFNGGSRDIHLADHYRLYAGNTYHFQLLLCRHGIDYGKEVVMQVSQEA